MEKIIAPAVHSSKLATKRALELKSFMDERIAASQLQVQINRENRMKKEEEQAKLQEQKSNEERKIAQRKAKEEKEKATNDIASLLGKSI